MGERPGHTARPTITRSTHHDAHERKVNDDKDAAVGGQYVTAASPLCTSLEAKENTPRGVVMY